MDSKKENVSREELYRRVRAEPISKLAVTYGVSGSYLARICRDLNVPVPGRGYWAQVQAGKKVAQLRLPDPRPGDATMWIRTGNGSLETNAQPVPPEPHTSIPPRKRAVTSFEVLIEAKERFDKAITTYSGVHLHPRHRRMVDVLTTKQNLDKSLSFAQHLFQRLQEYGYRVVLTNGNGSFSRPMISSKEVIPDSREQSYGLPLWCPDPCTVAYLGTVAIGLTIVEMTETQKTSQWYSSEVGSGRFRLYAYSPYRNTVLVRYWEDSKDAVLTSRFDEIIAEMEQLAGQIPKLIFDGEKRAQEEREKREAEYREFLRKRELEDRQKAESESRKALEELISKWAYRQSQLEFFDRLTSEVEALEPEQRTELLERVSIAKSLVGDSSVIDLVRSWKTPRERLEARSSYWDSP